MADGDPMLIVITRLSKLWQVRDLRYDDGNMSKQASKASRIWFWRIAIILFRVRPVMTIRLSCIIICISSVT